VSPVALVAKGGAVEDETPKKRARARRYEGSLKGRSLLDHAGVVTVRWRDYEEGQRESVRFHGEARHALAERALVGVVASNRDQLPRSMADLFQDVGIEGLTIERATGVLVRMLALRAKAGLVKYGTWIEEFEHLVELVNEWTENAKGWADRPAVNTNVACLIDDCGYGEDEIASITEIPVAAVLSAADAYALRTGGV
jgi:hypothetical protein